MMLIALCSLPNDLNAQTVLVGPDEYVYQVQIADSTFPVGLYFNRTEARFEFRDLSSSDIFYINPVNGRAVFRERLGIGVDIPLRSMHVQGDARFGGSSDFLSVDENGVLSFEGASFYNINPDSYAFRVGLGSTGLFFNQADDALQFIDNLGTAVLSIDASGVGSGNTSIAGDLAVGSISSGSPETGLAQGNFQSAAATQLAALRGSGFTPNTYGYLGVLGDSLMDATGLEIDGDEIGALGIAVDTSAGLFDNFGVYGYSNHVAMRALHSNGNWTELGTREYSLLSSGPSFFSGGLDSDTLRARQRIQVTSNTLVDTILGAPLEVGFSGANQMLISNSEIQSTAGILKIQPLGGNVDIADGGGVVNISAIEPGNVNIATGGGDVNLSTLFFTDFADSKVGVRAIDPQYTFTIKHKTGVLDRNGLALTNDISNSTWHFYTYTDGDLGFFQGDSLKGRFDDVSGMYTVVSDRRFKEKIEDLQGARSKLLQLQPRTYQYKIGRGAQKQKSAYYGFVAQELEEVFPELVHRDEELNLATVSYTELIPLLVAALQEQEQDLEETKALEEQVAGLENELDQLKEQMESMMMQLGACCQSNLDSERPSEVNPQGSTRLLLSPNPSSDVLQIRSAAVDQSSALQIELLDLAGRSRFQGTYQFGDLLEIDVRQLPNALYFVRLYENGQVLEQHSFEVQR